MHFRLMLLLPTLLAAEPFPGTAPWNVEGDTARVMVDGIHRYLDRLPRSNPAIWQKHSLNEMQQSFRQVLGIREVLLPTNKRYLHPDAKAKPYTDGPNFSIHEVQWDVLLGLHGHGLIVEPKQQPKGFIVVLPGAIHTAEQSLGLQPGIPPLRQWARLFAEQHYRVLLPTLINRDDTYSANPKLGRATNQSHREFIHRMAYEMGEPLLGLEVQKVQAGINAFAAELPVHLIGTSEGGIIGLYAAFLEPKIQSIILDQSVRLSLHIDEEPLDHNLWGVHLGFTDVELIQNLPKCKVQILAGSTNYPAGPVARMGRGGAAPGKAACATYTDWIKLQPRVNSKIFVEDADNWDANKQEALLRRIDSKLIWPIPENSISLSNDHSVDRQRLQFEELVQYIQNRWRQSDATRRAFWPIPKYQDFKLWEQNTDAKRQFFWQEVIGQLPEKNGPARPRTRMIYQTERWTGYEVVLDVDQDIIAAGILLWPKDLKQDEKRPVVVCQHGLEGRPTDICDPKVETKYYASFGAKLADRGYIVYAPQNPYIFQNYFRQIQRKANPLKLSLFSFIIAQHAQTLHWLKSLPAVDAKRIAFYGLSYGGKTAMRVPAILKDYCLSICSGDFNEWIGKNVSTDYPGSYMWTGEYEMYEFDLGRTFNYAEMAYLIAPRPFMVERGHDDGVGIDEMVAYEYAKVRYLYANLLKKPSHTRIEFFAGGHEIHGQGTFQFLDQHLHWQPK